MTNKTLNRRRGFRAKSAMILNRKRQKGRHALAKHS